MISGQELFSRVRNAYPSVATHSAFPYLRLQITSPAFHGLDPEQREDELSKAIGVDVPSLRATSDRLFVRFDLDEPGMAVLHTSSARTWLGLFSDEATLAEPILERPNVVHFYGFKGGQGRTTLLAFMAMELARDGQQVLVVDLDAEAPSLDLVCGLGDIAPEHSIVGLRGGLKVSPLTTFAPRGGGNVSVLAFRPSSEEFDLDATALAFEASVYAPSHEKLATNLRDNIAGKYDVLLLDHRTGLGPTVPAWVRTLPGPVVVLDRLDGQSRRSVRDVRRIWSGLARPGVLVSYVPQSMSVEGFREHRRGDAWLWLEALAAAKSEQADEQLEAEDVEDHWVLWPDDNAFRRGVIPQRDEVGGLTRQAVSRLRELLLLTQRSLRSEPPETLHPSGASDQGLLIVTDALRELCQPNSPIRFIFGRKGTGKTRLAHELAVRKVGEPLVVAEDETYGGLPAQDPTLRALVKKARDEENFEGLWWTLILATLDQAGDPPPSLDCRVQKYREFVEGTEVRSRAPKTGQKTLIVDGLETMTQTRDESRQNIQALLNVCSAIETDRILRGRLSLRVFLRTDIARWGFENFEQQSHGKVLDLSWSTQTILNFVLSRLPNLDWFRETFPQTIVRVRSRESEIQEGAVSEQDCLELLLELFPAKLGRLNLNTTTFLRTYFSDDASGLQSYYPRVYDKFLESINVARKPLNSGRVGQDVIMSAHDDASEAFLTQVKQELRFLVPLSERDLDRFLSALKERRTPFVRKHLASEIRNSLKLRMPEIDSTLEAMKEIGIFEQHPSRPDQWRVGRLFKSALKMKFGTTRS